MAADTATQEMTLADAAALEEYTARKEYFFEAVLNNDTTTIAEMAKAEPKLLEERNAGGDTPLLVAVNGERLASAEALLKAGAKPDALDEQKYTPLLVAADLGLPDMISLLLKWKADVNFQHEELKISAMHTAAFTGKIDIMEKLLPYKPNLELRDEKGKTPLFFASWGDQPEAVRILKERGAEINTRDDKNTSPLDQVILERKDDMFDLLLELGADYVSGNKEGTTPVFLAALADNSHALEGLKKRGVLFNNTEGYMLLYTTSRRKAESAANLLLDWDVPLNVTKKSGKLLRDAFTEAGMTAVLKRVDDRLRKENSEAVVAAVSHGLVKDTAAPERATFARKPRAIKNQPV